MDEGLDISKRNLPHWRLEGSTYFVTWRLAEFQAKLTPAAKTLVAGCLKHYNGDRYKLYCYVVMDDHVHLIAKPLAENSLSKIIHTWKSFTAHKLVNEFNRKAPVWQDEYQDRIIRNEDELNQKAEYILTNPIRKWGNDLEYKWMGLSGMDY